MPNDTSVALDQGAPRRKTRRSHRFHNPPGSPHATGNWRDLVGYLSRQAFRPLPNAWPTTHVLDSERAQDSLRAITGDHVTWLGHAAFLITLGGHRVLIDPFLAERASPFQFAGPRRFIPAPLTLESIGAFDTLVISHNHYDHLCWHTLKQIPNKSEIHVICPAGLRPWFQKRGFHRVTELDWHESAHRGPLKITACPAIHHSRRGLFDANRSLWAAYLFDYQGYKLYFGGDSAMGPIFRQTGFRYGPIDLALIGIGAYSPRRLLRSVHASPEEAVEMARAIRAKHVLGMHWGTIELSDEDAFEPAERFKKAALNAGYAESAIHLPRVGGTLPVRTVDETLSLENVG
ncbi:MAG: MBL fold metallo-hydrolase [Litorivicinaceae bacterium]